MTKVMTATEARSNIYNLIDETAQNHEAIVITGKRNNAVMISQEDWEAIQETIYLNSIPKMVDSINDSRNQDNKEFSEDIEW